MGPWSYEERAATCCAAWWRLRISSITVTHMAPMLPNRSILFKHVCASRRFTRLNKSWQITGFTSDSRMSVQAVTHTASVSSERWLQKHWEMKHFFTSGFGDINKLDFENRSNKSYCLKKPEIMRRFFWKLILDFMRDLAWERWGEWWTPDSPNIKHDGDGSR